MAGPIAGSRKAKTVSGVGPLSGARKAPASGGGLDLPIEQSDVRGLPAALNNKVDKVAGKGLSTEDYTTEEKNKLASLENLSWSTKYW